MIGERRVHHRRQVVGGEGASIPRRRRTPATISYPTASRRRVRAREPHIAGATPSTPKQQSDAVVVCHRLRQHDSTRKHVDVRLQLRPGGRRSRRANSATCPGVSGMSSLMDASRESPRCSPMASKRWSEDRRVCIARQQRFRSFAHSAHLLEADSHVGVTPAQPAPPTRIRYLGRRRQRRGR